MPAKCPKLNNTMEHVVKTRVWVPTLQNRSEKSTSIGVPCKTTAKTRVAKTNFECQRNAETEKHYGTRGENASFECQHCKTSARRLILYPSPIKPQRKIRLLNANDPPETQRTLHHCSKNVFSKRQHCKTAARRLILYPSPIKPQRKCDFWMPTNPLKRREHYTTAVRMLFLSANTAKPQREG